MQHDSPNRSSHYGVSAIHEPNSDVAVPVNQLAHTDQYADEYPDDIFDQAEEDVLADGRAVLDKFVVKAAPVTTELRKLRHRAYSKNTSIQV